MSKLIKTFTTVPLELFRLNNGMTVKIRARAGPLLNPQAKHDIATEAGLVKPKALDPSTYKRLTPCIEEAPITNGCSS